MGIATKHPSDTIRELCVPASEETGAKGKLSRRLAAVLLGLKPRTIQVVPLPETSLAVVVQSV